MEQNIERKIIQKAMAYDLLKILEKSPEESYTVAELNRIIDAYIDQNE